jgi:hypothetical protein
LCRGGGAGLRWPELPTTGPVHAAAAFLVGVIVVSLLGNRAPSTTTARGTETISGHGGIVATATAASPPPVLDRPITLVHTIGPAAAVPPDVGTVLVRAPENGIHDSLSRIAARALGQARAGPRSSP